MTAAVSFREDRSQALRRLIDSAIMSAVALWLLVAPKPDFSQSRADKVEFAGWIGFVFFGLLVLRYAWSVVSPGTLTISSEGMEQDLGWRRKRWRWADIKDVVLVKSTANACLVRPVSGWPVRLFGWDASAEDLKQIIDRARHAAAAQEPHDTGL